MNHNGRPAADLGPRQERFVEEYLVDLNAKQAAIRAGYSPRSDNGVPDPRGRVEGVA